MGEEASYNKNEYNLPYRKWDAGFCFAKLLFLKKQYFMRKLQNRFLRGIIIFKGTGAFSQKFIQNNPKITSQTKFQYNILKFDQVNQKFLERLHLFRNFLKISAKNLSKIILKFPRNFFKIFLKLLQSFPKCLSNFDEIFL